MDLLCLWQCIIFALQVLAYIVFRTGLFSTLFAGSFDSMLGNCIIVFFCILVCLYFFIFLNSLCRIS